MATRVTVSSSVGRVPGRYREEWMVCQYTHMTNSMGCSWTGCDLFAYTMPVLMAQLVLIVLVTRATYFFLKPLKQSMISAQLIAGIIIGSSFLARNRMYAEKLFPPGGRLIIETVANIGFMLHLFILGVQIDATIVKKAGRNAVLIGTIGFVIPYALGGLAVLTVPHLVIIDDTLQKSLPFIVTLNSMSTFPVITSLLADLKILNSDLGRLASNTSIVSDFCSYFMTTIMGTIGVSIRYSEWDQLWAVVWIVAFLILIVFAFRPLILQIVKQIPGGQPMKEIHFLAIVVIIMVCGFCAENLGQPAPLGAFILGMAVPDGPPLGTSLVDKLDALNTGLLLPAKFAISGLSLNLFSIERGSSAMITLVVIILGYIGKFAGTFIPALYYNLPFWDAIISHESYALLLITMLIVTGVARPLICHLYDPSKRYSAYQRNSILHSHPSSDLRMLVCIHNEDNVPTILNLLEASNPARNRPISVFVLNLMELAGRAAATLVPNIRRGKLTSVPSRSGRIVNAFDFFMQHNQGFVKVQHYIAIAPYKSMHDDICTVALDRGANIVIVPFHKQWTIDGTVGVNFPSIRTVNQNVIQKAPCSVGILIDRGQMGVSHSVLNGPSLFRIAVLFIGGEDDREALAYSSRMANHPHIHLTMIWLRPLDHKKYDDETRKNLDSELINQFRANAIGKERITYKEEAVKDAVGTTRLLRSLENSCDLLMVGRYHEPESPLMLGLIDWNECPELGVIGDMLATSDFLFSVLVVQQQPPVNGFLRNNTSKVDQNPSGRKAYF
ncbi:unnamed protein product [Ilex paraguariensis]|uniref:Cation/H+ exchanger domain-containing protein n=1 Tax=Ilex paraguariensis TaxID=185542 RepID=A0ABC8T3Z1_9AQUA